MLFADSEDEKKLWLLYKYSWGGTVVAGLDAVPLCKAVRHPRRRPRPRPGRLGQQLRLLPCTQNQGRGSSHAPQRHGSRRAMTNASYDLRAGPNAVPFLCTELCRERVADFSLWPVHAGGDGK